jgi:hypothetical protein
MDSLMDSLPHPPSHETAVHLNMIAILKVPNIRRVEIQGGKEGHILQFLCPAGQSIQNLPGMAAGYGSDNTIPALHQPHGLLRCAEFLSVLVLIIQQIIPLSVCR